MLTRKVIALSWIIIFFGILGMVGLTGYHHEESPKGLIVGLFCYIMVSVLGILFFFVRDKRRMWEVYYDFRYDKHGRYVGEKIRIGICCAEKDDAEHRAWTMVRNNSRVPSSRLFGEPIDLYNMEITDKNHNKLKDEMPR